LASALWPAGSRSEETSQAGGFAYPDLPPSTHGITYETPLTPQFNLSYKPNETNFFYATIAKGFRIGGVNTQIPRLIEGIRAYA
jgi:outer membrane receptor protein involved in Fe transport